MIPFAIQQQKLHGSPRILIGGRHAIRPLHRSHLAYAKSRAFGLQERDLMNSKDVTYRR